MKPKLPAGTLEKLWEDPNHWRGNIIYICKEDPRLVVPKKQKWAGWTLNCAHPLGWALLAAVALGAIIPAIVLAQGHLIGSSVWYAFLGGFIVIVCVGSWLLSASKRHERKK